MFNFAILFQENIQVCGNVTLKTFDELTVRLSLDSTNLQHRKLVFQLVKPYVPDFSHKIDKHEKEDEDKADTDVIEDLDVVFVKETEPDANEKSKKKRKETAELKANKKSKKK